jgi:lipopolysaccharide/colanic/teichoic acid biosynthesis glycosyltransferase
MQLQGWRKLVNVRRSDNRLHLSILGIACEGAAERRILNEQDFQRMISLERKRSERSGKPFLLMLLELGQQLRSQKDTSTLRDIFSALSRATRETDAVGWHEDRTTPGVMFTEIGNDDRSTTPNILLTRISAILRDNLSFEHFEQISFSFHIFPEHWENGEGPRPGDPALYPDLLARDNAKKSLRAIKRAIDITGSLAALIFLSPVFLLIAVAIKATSKGPVFYRQSRSGRFAATFSMLKFRSMYENSTSNTHKEYVRQLIAGVADKHPSNGDGQAVYKLTRDSRITRAGAFLRRTSLDELPQFINVLLGDMSLVGPRPPIDYEVEEYELWHRRRLMEAKPGITGLWQVGGRNRVSFDEMVRLDLQYARSWSPWLDLKILLRTPRAVIEGAH